MSFLGQEVKCSKKDTSGQIYMYIKACMIAAVNMKGTAHGV